MNESLTLRLWCRSTGAAVEISNEPRPQATPISTVQIEILWQELLNWYTLYYESRASPSYTCTVCLLSTVTGNEYAWSFGCYQHRCEWSLDLWCSSTVRLLSAQIWMKAWHCGCDAVLRGLLSKSAMSLVPRPLPSAQYRSRYYDKNYSTDTHYTMNRAPAPPTHVQFACYQQSQGVNTHDRSAAISTNVNEALICGALVQFGCYQL
jgi:hypothetical protein